MPLNGTDRVVLVGGAKNEVPLDSLATVQALAGTPITVDNQAAAVALDPAEGDPKMAVDATHLYVHNGTAWMRIALLALA